MQMLDSKGDYQQGAPSQPQQQAQQPQQAPPSGFQTLTTIFRFEVKI